MRSTSIYVHLPGKKMAAILCDDQTDKYYYQIITASCLGVTSQQINIAEAVGPFDNFKICSNEVDKLKGNV